MGCKQSKAAAAAAAAQTPETLGNHPSKSMESKKSSTSRSSTRSSNSSTSRRSKLYKLLNSTNTQSFDETQLRKAISAETAAYQDAETHQTALHLAVRKLEILAPLIPEILQAYPDAVSIPDKKDNIPLHYAIAPDFTEHLSEKSSASPVKAEDWWKARTAVAQVLIAAAPKLSQRYFQRNNVVFDNNPGCTPLYYAVQTIPDDSTAPPAQPPTYEFLHFLTKSAACRSIVLNKGNAYDNDKPLALLYRRFTRQFDLAEKFFAGDNSRPQVVQHRIKYKTAAGNTWKIIELLLSTTNNNTTSQTQVVHHHQRTVHRAVCGETPPDLLRYIVETNAEDLTVPDEAGNLPLHYAAKNSSSECFPAFYSKYVIDELLYKYPEAAAKPDGNGNFPLTLAVNAGKQWIGGGIKSLYDAYPEALQQIDLEEHAALKHTLSLENNGETTDDEDEKEEKDGRGDDIIRDEQHDAIMLVQQPDVDISEIVTSMWAHEEDAGVQMLGCVAISKLLSNNSTSMTTRDGTRKSKRNNNNTMRIALSAVPAVVNAMKAHPNEVIVQEKACHTLSELAGSDGKREISFVASGAVAAIVGAMQAHVSDANVQEEACAAVARIIRYGGADRATIVASVSGLTAIVNALAAHPEARQVQRYGILALIELTEYRNTANLPDLPRSQTEALLQAAKQKFPDECSEGVDVLLSRLS